MFFFLNHAYILIKVLYLTKTMYLKTKNYYD